jgi:hypothetical protein
MGLLQLQKKLIQNGVKNLKEFGYKNVTEDNILIDEVYLTFFKKMLNDNLGIDKKVDEAINDLLNNLIN